MSVEANVVGDHGPVTSETLAVVVRHDPDPECETCGGEGLFLDDEIGEQMDCPCGEDLYREPMPADLLTDPRVAALVRALRRVSADYTVEEEEWQCVDAALAPFEEVTRGG